MDAKFRRREIVWAKIQPYPWWPGKIINIHIQCNQIVYKILFFADPTSAYLQQSQICSYQHFNHKSNHQHHANVKLKKALKLADEAYNRVAQVLQSKELETNLQCKRTQTQQTKQSSLPLPQQQKQSVSSNEYLQLPYQGIIVQSQQASFTLFEEITKENILDILSSRVTNAQKFQYNYENRKKRIQQKILLKNVLLQRYNLHEPPLSGVEKGVHQLKKSNQNEVNKQNRKQSKRCRMNRKKVCREAMPNLRDKCIRKLYGVVKRQYQGCNSLFNCKQLCVDLMKRIFQISQQNETRYKSIFIALLQLIQNHGKAFTQKIGDFDAYLQKLQSQKREDEEGSKVARISAIRVQ